jgi:asparaginyl-tRNA synthetase
MDISGELYTSEKHGNDTSGDGTESKPFKTILQAMKHAGKEPFPVIYVDSKTEGIVCDKYFFFI